MPSKTQRVHKLLTALALLAPALACAADATPAPNKGDTAWMLTSTAFVLLMSVPALALFYGGLVRTKNMLSVLMQVFVGFSLITVLWCIYGYSLAFTGGNAFIGGLSRLFLNGTFDPASGTFALAGTFSKNTPMYELVYVAFQGTFAAITCCLILGAVVERIKFSGALLFLVLWFSFCYLPVSHMVWFWAGPDAYSAGANVDAVNATAGLIWQWGALDFAGGTVVHINAGVAGLVGAFVLGKRIGFGKEPMPPHSLTMTMIGASLLWFGWFGFNAGLGARGQRLRGARLHEHISRDGVRGAVLDRSWSGCQGKTIHAGCRLGSRSWPRCHYPGSGQRRYSRRVRHRPCRWRRVPLGSNRFEKDDPGRRFAGCIRGARVGRHLRRADDRYLQRAATGWARPDHDWMTGKTGYPGIGAQF